MRMRDILGRQGGRQRARDIGQAPGLDQGIDLRGDPRISRRLHPARRSIMVWVIRQMPSVGAAEALRVEHGILADDEPCGNLHAAVDDDIRRAHAAADLDIGQDHRVIQPRIGIEPDAGEQQRTVDAGAGDDAAAGDERGDGHAAPPVLVMHELRRRRHLAIGPDRPFLVIEVEVGHDIGEIDIGLPIGIDRADIAPIGVRPPPRSARRSARSDAPPPCLPTTSRE